MIRPIIRKYCTLAEAQAQLSIWDLIDLNLLIDEEAKQ